MQQRADGPRTNLTHCQRRSRSSALTVDEDGPVGYKKPDSRPCCPTLGGGTGGKGRSDGMGRSFVSVRGG